MRWNSLWQLVSGMWRRKKTPIVKRSRFRYTQLMVDHLEAREMLSSTPPTILQSGVLPITGSTLTSALPAIQVDFSDSMTNAVLNTSNYVLLGSTGILVPIN